VVREGLLHRIVIRDKEVLVKHKRLLEIIKTSLFMVPNMVIILELLARRPAWFVTRSGSLRSLRILFSYLSMNALHMAVFNH
jgi:hypothetical protein